MPRLEALVLALFVLGCEGAPSPIGPLDLNRATVEQMEALPAIGPKLARSIMAARNARGGRFANLDEVLAIDGVGPKTIDAIRPYVVVR